MQTTKERNDELATGAATIAAEMLRRAVRIVSDQLQVSDEIPPALRPTTAEQIDELTAKRYPELVAAAIDAQARIYAASLLERAHR